MVREIHFIANPMISESSFPDFPFSANNGAEFMRVRAFDQLDRAFEGYVIRRSQQEMNMLGHQNKRMQFVMALAAMSVKRFQEKANVRFDNKESSSLPC
jgi:hypothetical protein